MADCGFEKELGNGLKAGIVGAALGAIAWLIWGDSSGGRRGQLPPSREPGRDRGRDHRPRDHRNVPFGGAPR